MHTCMCAYQEVKNASFSEKFVYIQFIAAFSETTSIFVLLKQFLENGCHLLLCDVVFILPSKNWLNVLFLDIGLWSIYKEI